MERVVWELKRPFKGHPIREDFELIKEDLPELKDGEVTLEAIYLSPDPYQRLFSGALQPPSTMMGSLVSKIVRSKNPKYSVGAIVASNHGWILRDNVNPDAKFTHAIANFEVIDGKFAENPSHFLGLYGLTGLTAYFALIEKCRPQRDEVIFLNSAAGAVGHIVAQIAKILGCKVIGTAGTDEKVTWLKEELNLDFAYNYKTVDLEKRLQKDAPQGIDCFFDNVGNSESVTVMSQMNVGGRVVIVGTIDTYGQAEPGQIPDLFPLILGKKLAVSGFHFFDYMDRMDEGRQHLLAWVKSGQLKVVRETILNGFETMPEALIGLFTDTARNLGKVIVKAYPD